ncbi:MAG: oligopeptide transport system substrate-binding protein, partial [Streptomyces sp.]|nr:oligopeptide transport system substrate-binding protein [Streptomyces sp.]
MRGATRCKWAACAATTVVLAATVAACGGGGGGGGGGGSSASGVLSASWSDPQNPLEPANTNEVQGGKVLSMIFRGLKRYNPKTGAAENMIASSIDTSDSQNFTIKLKSGWTFSNGQKVTSASFIDAWNYAAVTSNKQINASFFSYIDGFGKVHPETGSPSAKTLSGLKKTGDLSFTVKLNQKFSTWPDTLGYSAFMPLPQSFFTD